MNLEHLRTPNPLNEFDYAAVRARVHAELAARRRWWMLFRFSSAFAAAMLAVVALIPVDPAQAPSGVRRRQSPLLLVQAPQPQVRAATSVAALQTPHRKKRRRAARAEVARIEIHTADPDVRIIWIVPKENS